MVPTHSRVFADPLPRLAPRGTWKVSASAGCSPATPGAGPCGHRAGPASAADPWQHLVVYKRLEQHVL